MENLLCESCGEGINSTELFCSHCRYPTGVHSPYRIGIDEISSSLSDLVEVMKDLKSPYYENKEIDTIFDELVRLYWLRPENALFRFVEARILYKYLDKYLIYPMLDMGCGEGLFTSVLFGAKVNEAYDNYESVNAQKNDPYNNYVKVPEDFFLNKPFPIGSGVDFKESSVKKARDLCVYDSVEQGDVRDMPYENGQFNSIFSNMVNDIKENDLEKVFCEVHRVLKKEGYFVFTTPNEKFLDCMYYHNKKELSDVGRFDKGRSEWAPRAKAVWVELSNSIGWEMESYVEYGDKNLISFWDTGFRPLFNSLIEFRAQLKRDDLFEVRKVWVEFVKSYLYRFVESQKKGGGFSIVVMKRI
jgi:SAM-dependent methyltransferase